MFPAQGRHLIRGYSARLRRWCSGGGWEVRESETKLHKHAQESKMHADTGGCSGVGRVDVRRVATNTGVSAVEKNNAITTSMPDVFLEKVSADAREKSTRDLGGARR